MKTLALVVPSLASGGGVPAVARFVRDAALRSDRYRLQLVSLCMSSNEVSSRLFRQPRTWLRGPITTTGEWESLPYIHVGANWAEIEFQRYMPRQVLSKLLADCDLVQVVSGCPAWANAVVGLGKPVALQVATRAKVERRIRDATPRTLIDWWRRGMTEITNRLDDHALRKVDAIQVENPWMLEYAKSQNFDRIVDIRYAPPGLNSRIFSPLITRDLAVSSYILCVGRLGDPRKNVGLLLRAYAGLSTDLRQKFRLVLAGYSGPPQTFWEEAEALGIRERISYIPRPPRRELISLYQNAAIFALSSDEEGLGVVVLEAMSCAVPVVSTRSGGPEGIITHGKDGFLLPRSDPASMTKHFTLLLENSTLNLVVGREARKTILSRYEERVAGKKFVDMWDRLIESYRSNI